MSLMVSLMVSILDWVHPKHPINYGVAKSQLSNYLKYLITLAIFFEIENI